MTNNVQKTTSVFIDDTVLDIYGDARDYAHHAQLQPIPDDIDELIAQEEERGVQHERYPLSAEDQRKLDAEIDAELAAQDAELEDSDGDIDGSTFPDKYEIYEALTRERTYTSVEIEDDLPSFPFTDEQNNALEFLTETLYVHKQAALNGPAGSGKTTLMFELVKRIKKRFPSCCEVTVAAMTNKAANVLTTKGAPAITFHAACLKPVFKNPWKKVTDILERMPAQGHDAVLRRLQSEEDIVSEFKSTALSAACKKMDEYNIYAALRELGVNNMMEIVAGWSPAEPKPNSILIVDEASMLSEIDYAKALKVYRFILLVGDNWQLPPVKGKEIFHTFPEHLKFTLTQIHRQSEMSQPLRLATKLRLTGEAEILDSVPISLTDLVAGIPVIVWRNKVREALTKLVRKQLGYHNKGPQKGEIIICRVNDRTRRELTNNSFWRVTKSEDMNMIDVENIDNGVKIDGLHVYMDDVRRGNGIPFRYAYAQTCHSTQSGEFSKVMIHRADAHAMRNFKGEEFKKWYYTGVTRAKVEVMFVREELVK